MTSLNHEARIAGAKEARLQAAFDMAANLISGWESLDGNSGYEGAPRGSMMTEIEIGGGRLVLFAVCNETEPGQEDGVNCWRAEVQFENGDGDLMEVRRPEASVSTRADARILATAISGIWVTEIEIGVNCQPFA